MAKNVYTVIAGNYDRPAFLDGQALEKGTGQTSRVGPEIKYVLQKQDIGIPNYVHAWGMRVYEDGKKPQTPIEVKDPKYTGKIVFLPFGEKGGTLIECRYLKGYNTLDVQYQDLVLNVKINQDDPSSADAFFLVLKSGENEFNEDVEPMKVQMLKISSYNQNSTYRSPEAVHWLYTEKNEQAEEAKETKVLNLKGDALRIVAEASTDNTYVRLQNLFNIVRTLSEIEPEDDQLYGVLLKLADKDPETFLNMVQEHKKYISNIIEKAKSYKVIDYTKDGILAAGKDKVEIIADGIPAKGENMLTWLVTNHTEQKANEAIFKLKKITDTLK